MIRLTETIIERDTFLLVTSATGYPVISVSIQPGRVGIAQGIAHHGLMSVASMIGSTQRFIAIRCLSSRSGEIRVRNR